MGNKGKAEFGENGYIYAREKSVMPDYSNAETRITEDRLGPFVFENVEDPKNDLLSRGPYELDNEAIYHGQWTRDGLREGKGI